MLLVIHNLPYNYRYIDVKALIQKQCNLSNVILDDLALEGTTKKVTVGLADEGDAAFFVRKMNGIFVDGNQLFVEDVRLKKASEQPYRPSKNLLQESQLPRYSNMQHRDTFQTQNNNQQDIYGVERDNHQQSSNLQAPIMHHNHDPMMMTMNYPITMGSMYYMAPQTPIVGYGGQQIPSLLPQVPARATPQENPFGFKGERGNTIALENKPMSWDAGNDRPLGNRPRQSSPNRGQRLSENFKETRWNNSKTEQINSNTAWRQTSLSPRDRPSYSEDIYQTKPDSSQHHNNNDYPNNGYPNYHDRNIRSNYEIQCSDRNTGPEPAYEQRRPNLPEPRSVNDRVGSLTVKWNSRETERDDHSSYHDREDHSGYAINPWDIQRHEQQGNSFQDRINWDKTYSSQERQRGDLKSYQNQERIDPPRPVPPPKRTFDRSNHFDEPQSKKFAGPRSSPSYQRDIPKPARNWNKGPPVTNIPNPVKDWKNNSAGQLEGMRATPKPYKNKPSVSGPSPNSGNFRSAGRLGGKQSPVYRPKNTGVKPTPSSIPQENSANNKVNFAKVIRRDQTWRSQAAAAISKEVLVNLGITDINYKDEIIRQLRASIKSRLEVLLGDELAVPEPVLIKKYRNKFPPANDRKFFLAILDKIKEAASEFDAPKKVKSGDKAKEVTLQQGDEKEDTASKAADKSKEKRSTVPQIPNIGTVPPYGKSKHHGGEKAIHKQQKALQKKEMLEDLYELPPDLQKAVNEECDYICDLFMAQCEVPDKEEEKTICEHITDVVADDFRKLMRLNLTKRLLNITTCLLVRIYWVGTHPQRASLKAFLKQYGVINLKRSDRKTMYIANLDSYENYDALCTLETADIDGITLQFKPLHVSGPPAKVTRAQTIATRNRFIHNQIDHSGEDLLKKADDQPGDSQQDTKQEDAQLVTEQDDSQKDTEQDYSQLDTEQDDSQQDTEQDDSQQVTQQDDSKQDVTEQDNAQQEDIQQFSEPKVKNTEDADEVADSFEDDVQIIEQPTENIVLDDFDDVNDDDLEEW